MKAGCQSRVCLPMDAQTSGTPGDHLTADDTIGDLLNHPAFAGFARLLLPWDDRACDDRLRLRNLGSLLPYHSHVDPETVISGLNHMIDDVNRGNRIFYDFYTETKKKEEPTRTNTGLFFLRGKPGAPFAIIAPGGGFAYVGSVHEGFPYAMAISGDGYNAFVLRYRVGAGAAVATADLAAAISFVFRNASLLGVNTNGYSVWGSSAGARMAAAIGSHGVASFGGDVVSEALRGGNGTNVEFHRYSGVGHGFGLGIAAALEDVNYPIEELIYDLANLDAGFRFCGEENRWAGRLPMACYRIFGIQSIPGYLENGVPPRYGSGAEQIVASVHKNPSTKSSWITQLLGVGDIDRVIIEWRSLLRQISNAPSLPWPRWQALQAMAKGILNETESPTLTNLPPLDYQQTRRIEHPLILRRH